MKKIKGRFYLKRTSNGNLVGEWSNHSEDGIFTESADLQTTQSTKEFVGVYLSTWQENGVPIFTHLTINLIGNTKKYHLEWTDPNLPPGSIPKFRGEGMICDGILIGDYFQP
jgi:hypothetical protein